MLSTLPDFRYVGLTPERPRSRLQALLPWTTMGGAAWLAAPLGPLEAAVVGVATLAATGAMLRFHRHRSSDALGIVPWGIVVSTVHESRAVPWTNVRHVSVQVRHARDQGAAVVVDSLVVVETKTGDVFRGRAPGAVDFERLVVSVERWAAEAARPISADLEGDHALDGETDEPLIARLVAKSDDIVGELQGPIIGPAASGYRSDSDAARGRDVTCRLRAILEGTRVSPADPRPLAAMVAARLGAVGCAQALLRLISAPSPLLALVAKACALRLGAPLTCAGLPDELDAFVAPDEIRLAEAVAVGDMC